MSLQASINPPAPPPDPGSRLAEAAIGASIALLGACVAAGWILRIPALVQLLPGLTPMVLNTAICFVLSGAWLVLAVLLPGRPRAALTLTAGLLALAGSVTLQYAVGGDFGIDAAALHRWLASSGSPGRMSAFTGLAFIAVGLAMLLSTSSSSVRRDWTAVALASLVGAIGVAALVGYLFELHLVYARYPLGLVAMHTAVGLVALSVALWLHLVRERRVPVWTRLAVQDRITLASAAILTLIALAVAVGVFAALQARVTNALSEGLSTALRYRVLLAEAAIEAGLRRTRILLGRPAPARLLHRLAERPKDADAILQLSQSAASLIADGYRAASYYDAEGREIASAGTPLQKPALAVPLSGVPGAIVAWEGQVVIAERYPISDAAGVAGSALVQAPLPALDALLGDTYHFGESGESAVCAVVDDRLGCFPQPRIPRVHFVPAKTADGEPLPMSLGLAGETGVASTRDFRGQRVMAAYGPIGGYGLAMVVKIDTAEFYAPVRERLQFILPILVLLIVAGTFLLRIGVRPLAVRLARSEREAHERHRALDAMMANVADGMMMLDADGTIRSWNAAAERLFGYPTREIVGRNVSVLIPEELREANVASTRRFLATGQSNVVDKGNLSYPALRKDGSRFELEFAVSRMVEEKTPQLVVVFRDITERKAAERRLTQLALHDALTGLPNRASFERRLEEAFPRRRRGAGQLALMAMDLDRFKSINDSLGHAAGDQLLIAFARRLHGTLRENDLVARLGGDEFIIVAESLGNAGDAVAIAEKVLAAMREPFTIENLALVVTTSIGVALYRDGDTAKTLMRRADTALYEAKGAGRARYRLAE